MTALCPACAGPSSVIHSEVRGGTVRRRRSCDACAHRWNTAEIGADAYDVLVRHSINIGAALLTLAATPARGARQKDADA